MFGFLDEAVDSVVNTATDFIKDPVRTTVRVATQPVRDSIEVIDGLTEGELRTKAIARLGVDVASGMALSELIEWYKD